MIYVDFVDGQLFESTNDTDTTGSNYGSNASVKKIDFTCIKNQNMVEYGIVVRRDREYQRQLKLVWLMQRLRHRGINMVLYSID